MQLVVMIKWHACMRFAHVFYVEAFAMRQALRRYYRFFRDEFGEENADTLRAVIPSNDRMCTIRYRIWYVKCIRP